MEVRVTLLLLWCNSPSVPALRRFAEELRLAMNIELVERTNMLQFAQSCGRGKYWGYWLISVLQEKLVCNFF